MRRYNIYNNILGWGCFIIAAATYLLTIEPTASFWDCPEFISQAFKLEVGHPPGNPIFMLAGRFFVNFAGGDVSKVAMAVNSMSALLSAGTILLLFWTITHFTRRLIVADDATEISLPRMLAIFGSGICGALMYCWSDTFWFSAVEGEVYAFSSFCTALVVWLILKWENRADQSHADRYLILIAYVIGISIAVHLLNLLCIPAISLIVYYRKFRNTNATGSLITLGISAILVALILYGLVPGFIEIAQYFDLFFVNVLGCSYNVGVFIYGILLVASLIWSIYCLYTAKSDAMIRLSFFVSVLLSGIPFIGDSIIIAIVLLAALALYLWCTKKLPLRILTLTALSILVMFIGYSSYALLLIRSDANPPMNQNAPDNVFSLGSYLNREQYGDNPLLYGQSFKSVAVYEINRDGSGSARIHPGKTLYGKVVKESPDQPDEYVVAGKKVSYEWTPKMIFPRMYSQSVGHPEAYLEWIGASESDLPYEPVQNYFYDDGSPVLDQSGNPYLTYAQMPTFSQNFSYFMNYQLMYMYWRYFMWNFAGRQNDLQGQGEPNRGNWISGISFIDTPRLGDQSLLPYEMGKGNKGHNVFYMLPLLLGLIGLIWQAFVSKRGIEQFWVVFFLFFMTGIAIVLYLNQPPLQPRERDYAFAGSFYAFAIWVGMGVAALWDIITALLADKKSSKSKGKELGVAVVACVIALFVPIQVVSQTWDDHDRSGRFTTRDYGMNYLSSVDENGIIFTNGDNDTFPLWYAQEVEGYRTDVRVVNLSYLTTDWYVNQLRYPTYNAAPIDMLAQPNDYAFDRLQWAQFSEGADEAPATDALAALNTYYRQANEFPVRNVYIPVDVQKSVEAGVINPDEVAAADSIIKTTLPGRGMTLSNAVSLDIIATSAKNGWNRPVYFAMTVPSSYYLGLSPNLSNTGLALQVSPISSESGSQLVNTDKMYRIVTEDFRWGGLDELGDNGDIYLDETVRRMVTTHRSTLIQLATALYNEGVEALYVNPDSTKVNPSDFATDRFTKAADILELMEEKLPLKMSPYSIPYGSEIADLYMRLAEPLENDAYKQKGLEILHNEILRYASFEPYYADLKRRGLYRSLQDIDRYTTHYLISLLQSYNEAGGDLGAINDEITELGIDLGQLLQSVAATR